MRDVSIIIPTHLREDALENLLDDLANQNVRRESYEILVVDSPIGHNHQELIEKFKDTDLNLTFLETANIIAGKRNFGAQNAEGRLLIFLDDDMRVGPDYIDKHLKAHSSIGRIVSGKVEFPFEWQEASNYYRYKNSRHQHNKEEISDYHFTSMNFSISKINYWLIGGFDEQFLNYGGEDVEFGIRAKRYGLIHSYCKSCHAFHYELKGSVLTFAKKLYIATYYSSQVVLMVAPSVNQIFTFKYSEGLNIKGPKQSIIFTLANIISSPYVIIALAKFLKRSDADRSRYFPLLYKILTIAVSRRGAIDRSKGEFNDYFNATIY